MEKFTLKNSFISLSVNSFWAEINSLLFKNREVIYQKEKKFWQRQSPVLFPIIGGLKNGQYTFWWEKFLLSQHGFARDMEFNCFLHDDKELHFVLKSNEETRKKFPFDFELYIRYFVFEKSVKVEYEVKNLSDSEMFYSLWWHPAFNIWAKIDWYLIDFWKNMTNERVFRLDNNHLFNENNYEKFPIQTENNLLHLNEKLFINDAMIFKDLTIKNLDFCYKDQKIFAFHYENFPHLGIWKQKDAPFICIEPWDGYADLSSTSWNLQEKAGIQMLPAYASKKYSWTLDFSDSRIIPMKFVWLYLLLGLVTWIIPTIVCWNILQPDSLLSFFLFLLSVFVVGCFLFIFWFLILFHSWNKSYKK